jgi:transcriptional regulator with GAF, ATPase, and Fis domain
LGFRRRPKAVPSTTSKTAVAVAEALVGLADTLIDDYDVLEPLHRLVEASVGLLGSAAAGILLDDQRGDLAVVASSSEQVRLLESFGLQNAQGPGVEAVRSSTVVACADLTLQAERWPMFAPAAVEAGFASVVAVPMRLRNTTIGALTLFDAAARKTAPDRLRLAQAFADVATIGILQERSLRQSSMLADQLQQALDSRVVIEQAKGVLAERNRVTMEVAFQSLRRRARDGNLKLAAAAHAVISGEATPDGA